MTEALHLAAAVRTVENSLLDLRGTERTYHQHALGYDLFLSNPLYWTVRGSIVVGLPLLA